MAKEKRKCSTCGKEKDLSEDNFEFRSDSSCLRKQCRSCRRLADRRWKDKNKKKRLEYNRDYVSKNRDKVSAYMRQYSPKYRKYKLDTDIKYKVRYYISNLIRISFKKRLQNKDGSISEHLAYTAGELKEHLESQFEDWMTWDNWGVYNTKTWDDNDKSTWTWHIDHIVPQSKFSFLSMDDEGFQECWALDNLRPLSAKANVAKGARIGDSHK